MDIISQDAIKLGCSGGQGKRVQVIRITGNQDAGYQEIRESELPRYPDNLMPTTWSPDLLMASFIAGKVSS